MTSRKNNEYQMKILLKTKEVNESGFINILYLLLYKKKSSLTNVGFEKRAGNV